MKTSARLLSILLSLPLVFSAAPMPGFAYWTAGDGQNIPANNDGSTGIQFIDNFTISITGGVGLSIGTTDGNSVLVSSGAAGTINTSGNVTFTGVVASQAAQMSILNVTGTTTFDQATNIASVNVGAGSTAIFNGSVYGNGISVGSGTARFYDSSISLNSLTVEGGTIGVVDQDQLNELSPSSNWTLEALAAETFDTNYGAANFTVNTGDTVNLSYAIEGNVAFAQDGTLAFTGGSIGAVLAENTGTLQLDGNTSVTGAVGSSGHALGAMNINAESTFSGDVYVGGVEVIGDSSNTIFSEEVFSSGSINVNGASSVTFNKAVEGNIGALGASSVVTIADAVIGQVLGGSGTLVMLEGSSVSGAIGLELDHFAAVSVNGAVDIANDNWIDTLSISTTGTVGMMGILNGDMDFDAAGTVNYSSGSLNGSIDFTGADGTVNLSDPSFIINGSIVAGNGSGGARGNLGIQNGDVFTRINTAGGKLNSVIALNTTDINDDLGAVANAFTVNAAGETVTLSGANTYTGTTTVTAGTLALSGGSAIADTGAVVLANTVGAGLQLNASEEVGSISGGGAAGGNINLQANTLTVGYANTDTTYAGVISGVGGALTKTGTGTLTLSGANTYTGDTTVTGGGLTVTGGTFFNGGSVNTTRGDDNDAGSLSVSVSGDIDFGANDITTTGGADTLNAGGHDAGSVTLNSTTGEVEAGDIAANGSDAGVDGGGTSDNGGAGGDVSISCATTANIGSVSAAGGSSPGNVGSGSKGGSVTLTGGTFSIGAISLGGGAGSGGGGNGGNVTINVTSATIDSISAVGGNGLEGSGSGGDLTLNGGTVTVGGNIDLSAGATAGESGAAGKIDVKAGSLVLTDGTTTNSILSPSTITIASGAELDTTGLQGGGITLSDGQTLTGKGTVTGDLTIGDGSTLSPGSSPGTLSTVGDVIYAAGGTYVWEIDSVIADPANQDFHDITGNLTIDPTFTFQITSLTGAGASGDVSDFNRYANYTWNLASVSGPGNSITATTFTIDDDPSFTNNTSCSGVGCTDGAFSISVVGTDLVLSYTGAVNTPPQPIYWQGTTDTVWNTLSDAGVSNWENEVGAEANAVPGTTSNVWFDNRVAGDVSTTLGQDFTIRTLTVDNGTGAVTIVAGNTLTINGDNGNAGITLVDGSGALTINSAVTLGGAQTWLNNSTTNDLTVAGNVTNDGYTLTVSGAGDTVISGIISETGGITKTGTGTLTLSGANSYSGATAINVGTVKLGNALGLGTTEAGTTVASGGALDLNGQTVVGEAVTINGTGVSSGGALLNSSASAASLSGMVTLGSASTITLSGAGGLTLTGGITNGGFDVAFDGANATTVSTTKITGSGGLVKNGSGTLTLSAANDYTGTTTINAGTLELSGGSAIANTGAVSLANVSGAILKLGANETIGSLSGGGTTGGNVNLQTFTLTTGDSNDTAYGGVISGTGGLTKAGSGVFTLTNANTYSGTTTISAGTLQVGSGGTTGALGTGAVTNHAALVFNRSDAVTVSNVISGSGMLRQSGSGILTLSSANLYSGGTTIDAGKTLAVSNASALGSGTVANGGTLDLGTTALNLGAGAYNQTGTLTFTVNSASVGDFGAISSTGGNVTGTITPIVSGYLANNDTLAIINGNGSLTYDAATVLTPYSHYTFTGSQSGGILTLTASRAENGFASDAGGDTNAANVGRALDNVTNPGADMLTVLNALDAMSSTEVAKSLQTMMLDPSSGTMQATRSLNGHFLTAINNRLAYARSGFGPGSGVSSGDGIDGMGFWTQGVGGYQKQNARDGIQGYSANTFGTMIGFDRVLDRHFRLGAGGGYGFGSVHSKTPGSPSTSINSFQGTIYGSYDSVDLCEARSQRKYSREAVRHQRERLWYVDGMLSFAQNNYDSRREIWIGSDKRIAKADHYGQQYGTQFETGYTFMTEKTRNLEITPFTSLGYNYLRMNKYKEKGADALDLKVDGDGFNQLEQGLGLKLAYPLFSEKAGTFIPSIKGAWLYDYIADRFETTSSFAGGGPSFATYGVKPARNAFLLASELAFLNKKNMTLTGNFDWMLRDEFASYTYYLTVRFDF